MICTMNGTEEIHASDNGEYSLGRSEQLTRKICSNLTILLCTDSDGICEDDVIPKTEIDNDPEVLICWDCNVNFTSEFYLNNHLLHHVKQPSILLTRVPEPLKITLKSTSQNSFEIVTSPTSFNLNSPKIQEILTETQGAAGQSPRQDEPLREVLKSEVIETLAEGNDPGNESSETDGLTSISFSPNFVDQNVSHSNDSNSPTDSLEDSKIGIPEYGSVPGAEPTPPPEPSPEYPKIRIKTGLLKESLTITEITDDNPNGEVRPEIVELNNASENNNSAYGSTTEESNIWATPSLEDPLRLPDGNDSDGSLISSLFSNNNDRAKDLGFTTSDSEFISLDRFDDRNRNALQVYNAGTNSSLSQNSLDTLAGLPMQQLAEQVSRLQPSSGTMHQQNVLINIQQFQQPPPPQQHSYQPPPMYPHPPHPGLAPQPIYHQPYQYQPPNHMYYPPGPGYAPHMPPPPRPPMSQPQMPQPPPQQMGQPMTSMAQPYRQPVAPRQPSLTPRQPMQPQPQRGQTTPRQPMAPRQPMMARQRAPMIRPRGGGPMGVRGPRPRMNTPVSTSQMSQNQQGPRMIKRSPEQIQSLQAKRKRMDVLLPDKHDDADCEVIAVQPKNTGLPQIQSIQGNAPEPGDNSVMHLSDSITLSVRNQPVRPPSPKKSDAKAVANILATRGITVTAAPKPKKPDSPPPKKSSPPPPVAINLNSAVSIIPTNKNNTNSKNGNSESKLTTVDLTDDSTPDPPSQKSTSPKTNSQSQKVLPFQCDLCPAKYPNSISLNKHRQSFHKTGGLTEFGIPLIDLKQPGLVHRLTSFGVYNYIPLPGASADTTFALPIISASNRTAASNFSNMGVSSILTLGPIRSLPKPVQNNINSK